MQMLQAGDKVPDFKGTDQDGNIFHFRDHKLGNLILFFFPKSMTPTCTVQACNLRDNYESLQAKGFKIIGISPDEEKLQKKFRDLHTLPFSLISDPEHKIMDRFGVWGEKQLYGRKYDGVHRTTFIIMKGKVVHVFSRPKNKQHAEEILEVLHNLHPKK